MSTPTAAKSSRQSQRGSGVFDTVQIGGHPLRYYVSGWRFGLLAVIVAALLPITGNQAWLVTAIAIAVYVLCAQGLNIVVGYAGLLDLGYVAFFVFGAYTEAVFTEGLIVPGDGQLPVAFPTLPFWLL